MPASTARAPRTLAFEVRRSSIQGRGAFATRRIRAGQRIVEYTGERIAQEEADRRYVEDGMQRHHTFLFTLDEDLVIDGAVGGNESRFINHSCEPNCEAVIEDGRIWIHALRTIQPGDELLYDYQYERTDAHTEEDERFYRCLCGAPSCRGSILAPKKKPRRPAAKRSAAKRGTTKRGTTKRGTTKRATTERGTAKRAAKGTKAAKRATKVTKATKTTKATRTTRGTKTTGTTRGAR